MAALAFHGARNKHNAVAYRDGYRGKLAGFADCDVSDIMVGWFITIADKRFFALPSVLRCRICAAASSARARLSAFSPLPRIPDSRGFAPHQPFIFHALPHACLTSSAGTWFLPAFPLSLPALRLLRRHQTPYRSLGPSPSFLHAAVPPSSSS